MELDDNVMSKNFDALRRHIKGEPPVCEVPMRVALKHGAFLKQVKAKLHAYLPEKIAWRKGHFELLFETGMVYVNL